MRERYALWISSGAAGELNVGVIKASDGRFSVPYFFEAAT
jgi:hypothetical protein